MKLLHYKREWQHPFYARRKHKCPQCSAEMSLIKVSKTVNSKSPEAYQYNFNTGDTFMIGNVKFVWDELLCRKCGYQSDIVNFLQQEKAEKKRLKQKKKGLG